MEKERERIERMLREGKITKEQSEKLLKALEESTTREGKVIKKSKRKIIMISTAVVVLVIIGGLLAGQKLQKKIPTRDVVVESERLYQRGAKLWREGKIDEAIKTLREVVNKYPKTNRAGCALMYLGQIHMGQNNYQKAIETFKEAVGKHPSSRYGDGVIVGAYASLYLGRCYIHEEKRDEAKRILNQLLEKYPESIDHKGRKLAPYVRSLLEEIETKQR